MGNQITNRDHPNESIVKIGQNTETSPLHQRRHALTRTRMKDHQITLVWKTWLQSLSKIPSKTGRGTYCSMKRLRCGENPKRDLPGRCTITITMCYSNDVTQSHTKENAYSNTNFINCKRKSTTESTWTTSNRLPEMKKNGSPKSVKI